MKLTFFLIFGLLITSSCASKKSERKSFGKSLLKFILRIIFSFLTKSPKKLKSQERFVAFDGIPKFIIDRPKNETQKGVTTWPMDYFLVKDSIPKNLLKLVLTGLIFMKVFVFIKLLILLFFVPAALTSPPDNRKFMEWKSLMESLQNSFQMVEEGLRKFKMPRNKL